MMNTAPYSTYRPPTMPHHMDEVELHEAERQTFIALGETILSKIDNLEVRISNKEEIMDSHAMCEYLKISPKQLYNLRRKYKLPSYKPTGKSLFFKRTEVDLWLETCGMTF